MKRNLLLWIATICLLAPAMAQQTTSTNEPRKRNLASDRYEINQTYDGQAFTKDNNIWVYTAEFAETFGMPKSGIDKELTGIEAAAFRIEDPGYKLCGMGGKQEQCVSMERCMLDVYVDERKYPLPWAYPEQIADWSRRYNSSLFLRTPTENVASARLQSTERLIPNPSMNGLPTLHPFADPASTKEAVFFMNSGNTGPDNLRNVQVLIYGFKRNVIAGLTLLVLNHSCYGVSSPREESSLLYRLESREKAFTPTLKKFHEFVIPATFNQVMQKMIALKKEADDKFFRSLLKQYPEVKAK